ncbi:MAG: TolC family protein [Thermoanaerobaculia bacterium]
MKLIQLAATVFLLSALQLHGQDTLTLEEAIALAQSRNERALQAAASVDAAEARLDRARTFFFPSLTINGNYTRRAYETVREIGGEDVVIQSYNALSGNATLNQSIFDARAFPLLRQARHAAEAIRLSASDTTRRIGFEAADAFIITLGVEQIASAAVRRSEFATTSLVDARARFEAGLVSSNDVTRAELELATARREVAQSAGSVAAAYLALGNLLNAEIAAPLTPPTDLLEAAARAERNVSQAIAYARENRPDLLALRRNVDAFGAFADEPRTRIFPRFDLVAQWRMTNEGGLSGRDEDGSAAVLMGWNLFDGGERTAERAERLANLRSAELQARAVERGIETEIRTALVDLESQRASFEAASTATVAARRNLEETTELYRQGLTGALQVADATTQLFEAEVAEARARYEIARAWLVYRAAVGLEPLEQENS